MRTKNLHVILIRPTNYDLHGFVERARWGFMPNAALAHMKSLTPTRFEDCEIRVTVVDEHQRTDLEYLNDLTHPEEPTLLACVGTQSREMHRALDLCALATEHGVMAIIGGPHPMTTDTTLLHGQGVSFAFAEAELIWLRILADAIEGELQPLYGEDQRWQYELETPVLIPPSPEDLRRNVVPMLGIYPARGCPFRCNFCSVIKIAGQRVRQEPTETTLKSLEAAQRAGVKLIFFTSDNFNKVPGVKELLHGMIDRNIRLPFFVQCDVQIAREEALIALMAEAGCWEVFVGAESFDRKLLLEAHKTQNRPEYYATIVTLMRRYGINSHFSNIIGFPNQTEAGVKEHLKALKELDPDLASFYILTPIPGTEQCDEFVDQRLFREPVNLDFLDATQLSWRHPTMSAEQLRSLVLYCYRSFYSPRHIVEVMRRRPNPRVPRWYMRQLELGFLLYSNWCGIIGQHPMAGGLFKRRLDHAKDYRPLRRKYFGIDLLPVAKSRGLSAVDQAFNRLGLKGLATVSTEVPIADVSLVP